MSTFAVCCHTRVRACWEWRQVNNVSCLEWAENRGRGGRGWTDTQTPLLCAVSMLPHDWCIACLKPLLFLTVLQMWSLERSSGAVRTTDIPQKTRFFSLRLRGAIITVSMYKDVYPCLFGGCPLSACIWGTSELVFLFELLVKWILIAIHIICKSPI